MVIHCYAGISRSTAGAFVAACALNPKRDEMQIAWDIRRGSRDREAELAHCLACRPSARPRRPHDRAIARHRSRCAAAEGDPFRLDIA